MDVFVLTLSKVLELLVSGMRRDNEIYELGTAALSRVRKQRNA
jgi:hypothetical protein